MMSRLLEERNFSLGSWSTHRSSQTKRCRCSEHVSATHDARQIYQFLRNLLHWLVYLHKPEHIEIYWLFIIRSVSFSGLVDNFTDYISVFSSMLSNCVGFPLCLVCGEFDGFGAILLNAHTQTELLFFLPELMLASPCASRTIPSFLTSVVIPVVVCGRIRDRLVHRIRRKSSHPRSPWNRNWRLRRCWCETKSLEMLNKMEFSLFAHNHPSSFCDTPIDNWSLAGTNASF